MAKRDKSCKPVLPVVLTKKEKKQAKYWLEVLEERRLTLLTSTLKIELSTILGKKPEIDRLLERCEKRMQYNNPGLASETITKFVELNSSVGANAFPVTLDAEVASNARHYIVRALERFTSQYSNDVQINLDLGLLLGMWRYGPGASIGCTGTHFADKITQLEITATSDAAPYVKLMRKLNPHCVLNDLDTEVKIVHVTGSSISTVPKNKDTHRTICTEPLGNMALQLAAGAYIEGALHCCGIDLSLQPDINRAMAYRGSLDGSLATIDLKSASDLITPALIKQLWPSEWFNFLSAIRSKETKLPDGSSIVLNMMSTMGNGFTFPMMTMTFLALIYGFNAKYEIGKNNRIDLNLHAVFGDDIICPKDSYEGICSVLSSAGLVINSDKSYNSGSFRESCGGDYDNGVLITPFYIESLTTDSQLYVAINKVIGWSAKHRHPLIRTIKCLVNMLHGSRGRSSLLVPEWESPDSGILTSACPQTYYKLVPIRETKTLRNYQLVMLSVLGGYVESRKNGDIVFTPRPDKACRYKVEKARLPKGWRDGEDPSLRDHHESAYAARLISAVVG